MASTEFPNSHRDQQGSISGDRDNSTSSSTSGEWTKVVTRGAAARAKLNSSAFTDTQAIETVTWAKLSIFQEIIFPILSKLFKENPANRDTPTKRVWNKALASNNPKLDGQTSWHNMQKLFKFKELQDYRNFIISCHGIADYLIMRDSTRTAVGFDYQVLRQAQSSNPPTVPVAVVPLRVNTAPAISATTLVSTMQVADDSGFIPCTGSKADFGVIMTQIWLIMDAYATAVPNDEHSVLWRSWVDKGLQITSDFQQVKQILAVDSLEQFYLFLRGCSPITTVLDFKWDNKILFRMALPDSPTNDDLSSITTLNPDKGVPDTDLADNLVSPGTPKDTTVNANYYAVATTVPSLSLPRLPDGLNKLTPKSGNVNRNPATIGPNLTSPTGDQLLTDIDDDCRESYSVSADDGEPSYKFIVFHAAIFDRIQAWTQTAAAATNPFRTKWQSWVFRGLNRYRDFSAVRRILGIHSLQEYVTTIQACPIIPLCIHWMWEGPTLHYMFIESVPEVTAARLTSAAHSKLVNMRTEVEMLQTQVAVAGKDAHNRIVDLDVRLDATDQRISRHLQSIESSVTVAINEARRQLNDLIASQLTAFNLQLTTASQAAMQSFRNELGADVSRLEMEASLATGRFQSNITSIAESTTERIQTDLYVTLDQLTDSLNAQAQKLKSDATTPTDPTKSHVATWRGITIDTSAIKPEPTKHVHTTPHSRYDCASPKDHYSGDANTTTGLPPLQYDYVIKRVNIQFTGQEDIVVFYNQLLNGTRPYGIFMNTLADVRTTKAICPAEVDGIPINSTRYVQMAGCLYQKLSQIDTIPMEFTFARNIVNSNAEENDGYNVLMALLEPILSMEEVLTKPSSRDWADIYEYAVKVNSYFKCETLAGRMYSQKEQCSIFLNGLDAQYRPAVRRARTLLETSTTPGDPSVHDSLKLAVLPRTIERYLTEETGQPTVRAMYHNSTGGGKRFSHSDRGDKHRVGRSKEGKDGDREKGYHSEKPCSTCLNHGHHRSQCNAFGKFLLLRYAESKMDATQREKALEAYKTELKKKATARAKRQQLGTVRELWDLGHSYDEVEHQLLEAMPHLTDGDDSSDDESESD